MLHEVISRSETDESVKVLEYLVKYLPECLDVKSDGLTPLARVFYCQETRFAKVLIDAGANQSVRDRNGNNLLHLAVKNRGEEAYLKELVKLLDPSLLPSLLSERSSNDPGSLTPLALWMHTANNSEAARDDQHHLNKGNESPTKIAVVRLLLDIAQFTGQQHLELLDGAGNTPVHDAVRFQLPEILSLMLERRPDLLNRENAVGSTPAEVARDAWVAEVTQDVPSGRGFYYNGRKVAHELLNRPAQWFVEPDETKSEREAVYEVCLKTASEGAGRKRKLGEGAGKKRKLVSLFEANEVARRLAKRNRSSDDSDDSDGSDCSD